MLKKTAIATVWRHRGLLQALTLRDIQNRYAGSVAGALWAFVNPLLMLAVYGVVFEYVFRVRVPSLSPDQPYVLFVATALWPWMAFQEGVARGTTAVQAHAALVKKVAFPHELLVYSTVLASFAVHLFGYAVVLTALRLMGYAVSFWAWPVVALGIFTLMLLATAAALLLGALQVFIRDVEQVLSQVLSVLFYATPILYSMSTVPAWLGQAMQWNPLVHVLETMRTALLKTGEPLWTPFGITLLASVLAFYLARRFFLRLSPYFEDMV